MARARRRSGPSTAASMAALPPPWWKMARADLFGFTLTGGAKGDGHDLRDHRWNPKSSPHSPISAPPPARQPAGSSWTPSATSSVPPPMAAPIATAACSNSPPGRARSPQSPASTAPDKGDIGGSLVADANGNIYGTTYDGGSSGPGTIAGGWRRRRAPSSNSPIAATSSLPPSPAPAAPWQATCSPPISAPSLRPTATPSPSRSRRTPLWATASSVELVNGTLYYSPSEPVTAADFGPDTIKYTLTDTVTGAVTTETQVVTLNDGPPPRRQNWPPTRWPATAPRPPSAPPSPITALA